MGVMRRVKKKKLLLMGYTVEHFGFFIQFANKKKLLTGAVRRLKKKISGAGNTSEEIISEHRSK